MSLTDAEVSDALSSAYQGEKRIAPTSGLRRVQLFKTWTTSTGKHAVEISRHFARVHADAVDAVKGATLAQIEEEIDTLIDRYGVRAVAFALVTSGDKYKQELGYELVNRRGDEVTRKTPEPETVDIMDLLAQIRSWLENQGDIDLLRVRQELDELRKLVEAKLESATKRAELLKRIEETAEACHRFDVTARWLGLRLEPFSDRRWYATLKLPALENAVTWFQELLGHLEEAESLRTRIQREFSPDLVAMVVPVQESLRDLIGRIAGLSAEKAGGPSEGGTEEDAGEATRDIKPERLESGVAPAQDEQIGDAAREEFPWAAGTKGTVQEQAPDVHVDDGPFWSARGIDAAEAGQAGEEAAPCAAAAREEATTLAEDAVVDVAVSDPKSEVEGLTPDPRPEASGVKAGGGPETSHDEGVVAPAQDDRRTVEEGDTPPEPVIWAEGEPESALAARYFWRALGAGDLPGAFWLALDYEKHGTSFVDSGAPPFPAWAMLAAFLSLQANLESVRVLEVLQEIILTHTHPVQELAERTGLSESVCARLVLLVAIRPMLLAPQTGAWNWFQAASSVDEALQPLVQSVRQVTRLDAQPATLRAAFRTQSELPDLRGAETMVEELRALWDRTKQGRMKAHLGTRVLRHLTRRESPLTRAVEAVLEGRSDASRLVRGVLNGILKDEDEIKVLIDVTVQEVNPGPRSVGLHGAAREQVVNRLNQLRELLEQWLHSQEDPAGRDNGVTEAVARFLQHGKAVASALRIALEDPDWLWSAPWALRTGSAVSDSFTAAGNSTQAVRPEEAVARFAAWAGANLGGVGDPDWEPLLLLPALFTAHPPVDGQGRLDMDAARSRYHGVAGAISRGISVAQAFDQHLAQHNYLASRLLLDHLERVEMVGVNELRSRWERNREAGRILLAERIETARARLEEAMIEHGLTEEERSVLDGKLLSIEESQDDRIGLLLQEVGEIEAEIERNRSVRRASLHRHIVELRHALEEVQGRAVKAPEAIREYLNKAESLVNEGDLALADEYLAHAEQALNTGELPAWEEIAADDAEDPVVEFRRSIQQLIQALSEHGERNIVTAVSQQEGFAGLSMRDVPGQMAKKSADALKAYLELKRSRGIAKSQYELLAKILEFIGFSLPQIRNVSGVRDRYHAEVDMSDGNSSPLPEFGSKRNGRYDVVVIFGQQGHEAIAQALHSFKVHRNCPIVLYMGRLSVRQRQEWSHYCRVNGLTAMLVDEALLFFLATRRGNHLRAAVSCGVAWGYANPYEPQGPVPPELFKGRIRERRALVDGRSAFIYGGRQFGKSVLLSVVERDLNVPDKRSYAFYEDIRQIGKQGPAMQIWRRVRSALVGAGLLTERASDDPDRLVERLISLMQENPSLRIAFLFDEADAFLDADQRTDFTEVHRLKRIVERSQWRFRVIFSGLHSVQRFERLQNQPFAHLGNPVVVGPLEPRAAIALIEEPMRALGFQFDRRETMLRILSYTNYHPALIQLFCKELVNLVRQGRDEPPYVITMEDVKSLYLRSELRSELIQRYEWTLDLDDRYRALVYAMILEQKGDSDGYRREFAPTELWELASMHWPNGFSSEPDESFRSYLEELCGLGILIRMPSGRYRLRNGNVVRALGSIKTIEERLEMIARKSVSLEPDFRQLMFGFDFGKRKVFGPLTIGQASDVMGAPESEVAVVMGSDALLLDRVPQLLHAVARAASASERDACSVVELPRTMLKEEQVRSFLQQRRQKAAAETIFIYVRSTHPIMSRVPLPKAVEELWRAVQKHRPKDARVRLALLLDPAGIFQWIHDWSQDLSAYVTEHPGTVILRRWTHATIKATLNELELPATDDVTTRVVEVTGGWPLLLDELVARAQEGDGVKRDVNALERIVAELEDELKQDSDLRKRFIAAHGLERVPGATSLLGLIAELKEVPSDDLPGYIELSTYDDLKSLSPKDVTAVERTLRAVGLLEWRQDGVLSVEPVVARCFRGEWADA